jgi:hypothetical protein
MEPINEPGIWHSLTILFTTLVVLIMQLAALGFHWLLWIVWAAWCLWGVNWKKTRHVLALGGWAPAVLLMLLIAIIWSRLATTPLYGFAWLPNFWWQLAYVSMLAAIAMFCGWLQGVFHWTPHQINLDPPAHGHGHDHAHGHH